MPTPIQIDAFDGDARSVTFTAYGQQKTIAGLGDFPSKSALVEYLQSVAETDMKAAEPAPLPDMSDLVGETVTDASEIEE